MVRVLVHFKLENYQEWRSTFELNKSYREKEGSLGCEILHNSRIPNEVSIIWNWDNLGHAQEYFNRTSWRDLMKISGVAKIPEILFFDIVEKINA
jgi:hypothetical protein